MSDHPKSAYELDRLAQPDALDAFAGTPMPSGLASLDFAAFDRIILTGMGSSDYATIPLEHRLACRGLPVWRLQTNRLLETPEMIMGRTLLWVTSQSGRSGEAVALMDRLPERHRPTVVAMTNDLASPLASGADHVVALRSGTEATVSSKSYLNTLAAVHRVCAVLSQGDDKAAVADVRAVAASLRTVFSSEPGAIATLADRALAGPNPRLALVGTGIDAATALTGALILKEASRVAAEGYIGGAFRHGPMELAGPGTTVLLFGTGPDDSPSLDRLARDLSKTGSIVVAVSAAGFGGAEHVAVPSGSDFQRLAHAMVAVQQLSLDLARVSGHVAGTFRYGQKITAEL